MGRIVIFGNSGSGKSSLAKRLAGGGEGVHLDLDALAWRREKPTERAPLSESVMRIDAFIAREQNWVIEGCYASLVEHVSGRASRLIFMNIGTGECVQNCRNRPWEPHKYASKEAQDQNLEMLIGWVRGYYDRDDEFSFERHRRLFDCFGGPKTEVCSNREGDRVAVADR